MTNKKPPAPETALTQPNDPYLLHGLEQLFGLFDGGDFLAKVMSGHKDLQLDLLSHQEEHGSKGCKGSMTPKINYALGKSGDVGMGATVEFKPPAKPPSSAAAYINDKGELTLYSPFMARMHQPIREVPDYDPETGEVRDVD